MVAFGGFEHKLVGTFTDADLNDSNDSKCSREAGMMKIPNAISQF